MRWQRAVLLALVLCVALAGATSGAPTSSHVHFTAAGDYAADNGTTGGVLDALAAGGSDVHLALGDMSYGATGQESAWCDFVKSHLGEKFPFELISGNHESNGLNGNINDFSACLPNQLPGLVGTYGRQWYVDVPQQNPLVRFVMISPNLDFPGETYAYTKGSARYTWVTNAIDGARSSGVPWVVVGMHKPCVSMGVYPCDTGADLMNLLLQKKVDLVLNGHEHMYQRTKQLGLGAGCTTFTIGTYNPSCVVDSDNSLSKGAGTVFATIGTGGTALRDVNTSDPEAGYFVTAEGANQNATYGLGDFDVTTDKLVMKFVRGAGGTFGDGFTITKDTTPPPNQPPSAAFTSSANNLTASLDATSSSDPDGTVASYAWDFGDGRTGAGSTIQHDYSTAGTYTVKLTVTDDRGATDTVSHDVAVTAPPPSNVLAGDAFERTTASGWGSADVGGPWTLRGTVARFRVADGAGQIQLPASATYYADLNSVSSTKVRLDAEFSVDKLAEGTYVAMIGRRTSTTDYYAARLVLSANGSGKLYLVRGAGVSVGVVTPSLTFAPGVHYRMALEVKGTSPTTLSTKLWKATDPEPTGWQRTGTDSYAALQNPGAVSLFGYLPGAASASAPVTVSFHQFTVTDAG